MQHRGRICASTVRRRARSLPRGASVLDCGCGSGVPISETLIEDGLIVYGVDGSPTLVAAFRRRFPDAPVACEAVSVARLRDADDRIHGGFTQRAMFQVARREGVKLPRKLRDGERLYVER